MNKITGNGFTAHVYDFKRNVYCDRIIAEIQKSNGSCVAVKLLDVLNINHGVVLLVNYVCLKPERILINVYKFFVFHEFERLCRYLGHVATHKKRRTLDTPNSHMHLFLVQRQTLTDFKHVHIVIMTVTAISRKIFVLAYDIFERRPVCLNISTDSPRICNVLAPNTGVCPTTDVV